MKSKLRLLAVLILALFAAACGPKYVKTYNVPHKSVPTGLTLDQVRTAVNAGAETAGWSTEELTPGSIVATYKVRVHTVKVLITYNEQAYSIDYKTSDQMKVYCTEEDKEKTQTRKITSGGGTCTGQPAYIHENYKVWVEELDSGIKSALQNVD